MKLVGGKWQRISWEDAINEIDGDDASFLNNALNLTGDLELKENEKAEKSLKNLGLSDLRVRHYEKTARLEVPISEIEKVLLFREEIVKAVQSAGYHYVTLDLEGLRSGNLNQELQEYD